MPLERARPGATRFKSWETDKRLFRLLGQSWAAGLIPADRPVMR
jgi:hypothetical protein